MGRAPVLGEAFPAVLAAAQAGAPWALERLYRAVAPAVAGYLRVQGCADADDITSDVMYRALSAIRSFRGDEAGFRSWVFTIAHHALVDERRRAARRPALVHQDALSDTATAARDVEEEVLRRLSTLRVRELCDRLPADQRDVLLLRMVAGMSLEETAAAVGKTVGAVKALQHRAVGGLRRTLSREGVSR